MSNDSEPPSSWQTIAFDEAVDVVSDRGIKIKQKDYLTEGDIPVVDQGEEIIGGFTNHAEAKILSESPIILFGDHTRRFKFIKFPFAVGADGVKLFAPNPLWNPVFLFLQLENIDLDNRGYGRHYQYLRKERLALPPAKEQTRIVEKLEELLSDFDDGVAELKAAQTKLVRYRQSLLKAAVEGALTAEWRQHNTPEETGAQLLQRILSERRAHWEAKQLAKFAEQGKAPPKDWQKKYPEPMHPDTRDLPELPQGWAWASLDQLTEFITSGSRGWADYYSAEGAVFIRSQNINKDRLDLSDTAFVTPPRNNDGIRAIVQKHDLLLTITGANVGKTACVEIALNEAYVSQHVALIRLVEATLDNFIHLYLTSSSGGRGQLDKEAYGAGKPGLNLQQVGSVHIPLPGWAETSKLMDILKTQLEAISEQNHSIDELLKQSTAQRKNILRAAFSGQLVPQDPNDEPASALLARIRAQREADTGASANKRGRKAKGTA